jgi:tRNA(fMet)-specific endonuclease VapC
MVCLDTNFLIALIRRDHIAEKKLEEYVTSQTKITTTPITACELFKGAYRTKKEENITKIRRMLTHLEILDFTIDASERYGKLVNELQIKGLPIGDLDTMIASIALTHGESLLTSNKEHFERIPSLIVNTW